MNALIVAGSVEAVQVSDLSIFIVAVTIGVTLFAQIIDAAFENQKLRDKRMWYSIVASLMTAYGFVVIGRLVLIATA